MPLLANFPYRIIKRERRNELLKNRKFFSYLRVYEKDNYLLNIFDVSTSQFYQDLFVLSTLGNKRGGFFIEMGACDEPEELPAG